MTLPRRPVVVPAERAEELEGAAAVAATPPGPVSDRARSEAEAPATEVAREGPAEPAAADVTVARAAVVALEKEASTPRAQDMRPASGPNAPPEAPTANLSAPGNRSAERENIMHSEERVFSAAVVGLVVLELLFFSVSGLGKESPKVDLESEAGFAFVDVEPGEFIMGSPENEKGRFENEVPHPVKITKPFQIGRTEVTQGVWRKVMGKLPEDVLKQDDTLPVTYVSWNDVRIFIKRLQKLRRGDGFQYRLPTEAEWEYAARGGHKAAPEEKQLTYSFGKTPEGIDEFAWSWNNAKNGAQPVATRKPNPLGVYDMIGNVWEWTIDTYASDPSKLPVSPAFGHQVNLEKGEKRVLRSGCWTRNARTLRSAFRGRLEPNADYGNLGVRLVRQPK
jgi:formylglycine-generating enzyme required for sulfatase activity